MYVAQSGFDNSLKDNFYDILGNVVRKLGKTEIAVMAGDFNRLVGSNAESLRTSMEIVVMELEINGKRSLSFVQL